MSGSAAEHGRAADSTDPLERELRALTVWDEPAPSPGLWERAAPRSAPRLSGWHVLGRPIPRPLLGGLAAAVFIVLIAAALLPSLGKARSVSQRQGAAAVMSEHARESEFFRKLTYDVPERSAAAYPPAAAGPIAEPAPPRGGASEETAKLAQRAVIRKATMEISCQDVRAAAAKAALLLNEAGGEYMEESSIQGDGEHARAQLTLRVASGRLSEVLNQLRPLGKVASESSTGTDVTAQVVDLEARLRNEQRVETELLDLLAQRQGAPLADVLQLRETIAGVRGEIERLTAQRDHLARLVSLGTVLLIIRGTDAPEPEVGSWSLLDTFGGRLEAAWRGGVRALAGSIGLVVQVLVGGAVWWVMLAGSVVLWIRWAKGHRAAVP